MDIPILHGANFCVFADTSDTAKVGTMEFEWYVRYARGDHEHETTKISSKMLRSNYAKVRTSKNVMLCGIVYTAD